MILPFFPCPDYLSPHWCTLPTSPPCLLFFILCKSKFCPACFRFSFHVFNWRTSPSHLYVIPPPAMKVTPFYHFLNGSLISSIIQQAPETPEPPPSLCPAGSVVFSLAGLVLLIIFFLLIIAPLPMRTVIRCPLPPTKVVGGQLLEYTLIFLLL